MITFFLIISLFSLSTNIPCLEDLFEKEILGIWVPHSYSDGKEQFIKKSKFHPNLPGMSFLEDGNIIVRTNLGWCGTPPIQYSHVQGKWKKISEETFLISYNRNGKLVEETYSIKKNESGTLILTDI